MAFHPVPGQIRVRALSGRDCTSVSVRLNAPKTTARADRDRATDPFICCHGGFIEP